MKPITKHWKRNTLIVLGLTLAVTLLAPGTEAGDRQLRANMTESFIIDGRRYEPAVPAVNEAARIETMCQFARLPPRSHTIPS